MLTSTGVGRGKRSATRLASPPSISSSDGSSLTYVVCRPGTGRSKKRNGFGPLGLACVAFGKFRLRRVSSLVVCVSVCIVCCNNGEGGGTADDTHPPKHEKERNMEEARADHTDGLTHALHLTYTHPTKVNTTCVEPSVGAGRPGDHLRISGCEIALIGPNPLLCAPWSD
jgi:hypothetical protein